MKPKDATFNYKKDGAKKGQSLNLNVTAIDKQYFDKEIDKISDITECDGIKIYYSSIKYKFVPEKYEKTDEDIKLMNEGLLEISLAVMKLKNAILKLLPGMKMALNMIIMNMAYDDVSRDDND